MSFLLRSIFRLSVIGRDHLPAEGGALLLPNHVSSIDALLIQASLRRPVRFLADARYARHPLLRPVMRILGVIPIPSADRPGGLLPALREAARLLDAGELVCIFPEGEIARTAGLLRFRQGFKRVVAGSRTPLIPVYLDWRWGSIFSRVGGLIAPRQPRRFPYPVTVAFGTPLPADTPAHIVRQAVQELSTSAWTLRKAECSSLAHAFIRAMRRSPFRMAVMDRSSPRLTRIQALAGAITLARSLRPAWADQKSVGILLPPSCGAALANFAAALAGRTSVNLNYAVGAASLAPAARQAGLRTVVTDRRFLERAGVEIPPGLQPIWLPEAVRQVTRGERLQAMLLAWLAPVTRIEGCCGSLRAVRPDDVATVVFTSGSGGDPKGVLLSHFNIQANIEAATQGFPLQAGDRLLGVLPFFHAFGYTATLWLPVLCGVGVIFHSNPLDAVAIGELISRQQITCLVTTPTFLQILRRCTAEQFGAVRMVLTGGERLPDRLAIAFEEKFGIWPVEGYGATECAPVIAVSGLGSRAAGSCQPSDARRGYVGQPLPGVTLRIVDPDTFTPLPPGTPGLLLVRGPNVMRGYLGREDLTAAALRDGCYITGDIAQLDEDGFLKIIDRLSRFSKIGGEMVPHGRVEDALQEAARTDSLVFAVTAVPDERKGEQLAVLHTLANGSIPDIVARATAQGLPNLFLPRQDHFLKVDKLPLLGSGKLDLCAVKRIATERLLAA